MNKDHKKTSISKRNNLSISFLLLSVACIAQAPPVNEPDYNRPALFGDLPDTVFMNEADMLSLFDKTLGEQVQLKLTNSFFYEGTLQSIVTYGNPYRASLVIKSSNKQGSALYITKIIEPSGTTIIRGRIIGSKNIDAYELIYIPGAGYTFRKNNYYKLVNE
jgi:small nuclear ribonucleoprotein (snRNP)-like protein